MLAEFGRAQRVCAFLVELGRRGDEGELRAVHHFDIGEVAVQSHGRVAVHLGRPL